MKKSEAKSLAVKAIRIGWLPGVEEAAKYLTKSELKGIFAVQLWEDISPTEELLPTLLDEIRAEQYEKILEWDTHHGKGYTEAYFSDFQERPPRWVMEECWSKYGKGLSISPRAAGSFKCWLDAVRARIVYDKKREVCHERWKGMPKAGLDLHVIRNRGETILSGTIAGHMRLARYVRKYGWNELRRQVLADVETETPLGSSQPSLF